MAGALSFRHLFGGTAAVVVHLVRGCSIGPLITHFAGCGPFLLSNSVHSIFRLYPFRVSWGPVMTYIGIVNCLRYSIYETAKFNF